MLQPLFVSMKASNQKATGGKRLASMVSKIDKPYLWIDTYNQRVDDVAGTIKARIDGNYMYYVSVEK
jgi:hypothetical protein